MNNQQELPITSIDDLIRVSHGTVVELPPFAEGQPFVARLKRPSMLAMVRAGKIPNALIGTANELFAKGTLDTEDDKALSNLFGVLDAICDACFVEPSYKDLQQAGVELTDDQYMFIFSYTQKGVSALRNFRSQFPNKQPSEYESTVPQDAE